MSCNECQNPFDTEKYIPKLLPKCGHTICQNCLNKIINSSKTEFTCSFDGIQYSKHLEFPDNLQFLTQAKLKMSEKSTCRKHEKRQDLFCKNCQEAVCSDCAIFGGHKHHELEQMVQTRLRREQKIRMFRDKVSEFQRKTEFKFQDLSNSIAFLKKEKSELIENRFKELIDTLTSNKRYIVNSINQFYEKVLLSFNIVRNRLNEIDSKISMRTIDEELMMNPAKEKYYEKEIENIESTIDSRLMINAKQQQELVILHFDKSLINSCKSYCRMICSTELFDNDKNHKVIKEEEPSEENLLHESFKEALKNATESLLKDEELTVQESVKFKNQTICSPSGSSRYINELKNYSPLSKQSGNSNYSTLKNDKSMLRKKGQNVTHKKSLNGHENEEETETKKFENTSPSIIKQNRITDVTSMKSSSTNQNACMSLKKFTEKENLTNSQSNSYYGNNTISTEKLNTLIDAQLKARSDTVDLSNLGLTDEMMDRVSRKLNLFKNTKTLKLSGNHLTENGVKNILKEIKSLSFEFIFLTDNNMSETILDYLISFRKYNTFLRAAYLTGNPLGSVTPTMKKKIKVLDEKGVFIVFDKN